jgi:hypothetical protein
VVVVAGIALDRLVDRAAALAEIVLVEHAQGQRVTLVDILLSKAMRVDPLIMPPVLARVVAAVAARRWLATTVNQFPLTKGGMVVTVFNGLHRLAHTMVAVAVARVFLRERQQPLQGDLAVVALDLPQYREQTGEVA